MVALVAVQRVQPICSVPCSSQPFGVCKFRRTESATTCLQQRLSSGARLLQKCEQKGTRQRAWRVPMRSSAQLPSIFNLLDLSFHSLPTTFRLESCSATTNATSAERQVVQRVSSREDERLQACSSAARSCATCGAHPN